MAYGATAADGSWISTSTTTEPASKGTSTTSLAACGVSALDSSVEAGASLLTSVNSTSWSSLWEGDVVALAEVAVLVSLK